MNRERAKRWKKEIEFWGDGGNLWSYDEKDGWIMYEGDQLYFEGEIAPTTYVMEDQHFKARKAFALGEEIEGRLKYSEEWFDAPDPDWTAYIYITKKRYQPARGTSVWVKNFLSDNWIARVATGEKYWVFTGIAETEYKYCVPFEKMPGSS